MSKLGLVLGAGGARGVAHLGVIKAFEECGIKPDIVVGCSMGALIGGLYCTDYRIDSLVEIMKDLKRSDIVDVSLRIFTSKGLIKGNKVDKLLKGFFCGKSIEECSIPFGCVATDLISGEEVFFSSGDMFTAVRASCSIPIAFPPVEYEDKLLVDGGLLNRIPIERARELGATKIISVDVMGKMKNDRKLGNIIDIAFRSIDCVDSYINENRIENNSPDVLIRPELGSMSQYKVENLEFAFEEGYKAGLEKIEEIRALLSE